MTDPKTDVAPVEKSEAEDLQRRNLALALFGALGGAALLQACALDHDSDAEQLGDVAQALSGTGTLNVVDTATNLRALAGGTALWIAVMQGYNNAGDGGGGVFYWSTTAKADDGWLVLNAGSGNSAGWRRVNPGFLEADNVTTLRATSGSTKEVAVLAAYSTAGDGGDGTFYWSTIAAQDNGGTILNLGSGNSAGWRRICSGPLNVRWFGAKGTGSPADAATNSTAFANSIQTASSEKRSVYIPGGTYMINTPVLLNGRSGLVIFGDGPRATQITTAVALNALIELKSCYQCSIRDLTCIGPASAPSSSAIYVHTSSTPNLTGENRFQNLNLEGEAGPPSGLMEGMVFAYDAGYLGNNDHNLIENVQIKYFQSFGIDFFGLNALGNRIIGGSISLGPNAVRCYGGSFDMYGTAIGVSDRMFYLDYSVNMQLYPVSITAVTSEVACRILYVPLQGNSVDTVSVVMTACNIKGPAPAATPDVIQCDAFGKFTFVGCWFFTYGGAGYKFLHSSSQVTMTGCTVIASQLVHNGTFTSIGNEWRPTTGGGTIAESGGAATSFGDFQGPNPLTAKTPRLASVTTTMPPPSSGQIYKDASGVLKIA